MALIVMSGYPSSGKTTRAQQIKSDFEQRIQAATQQGSSTGGLKEVVIVSDVEYDGRKPFDNSISEKPARAHVFTTVTRLLSPSRLVILDGLNYIKGFRYQLWCAAREARVRQATCFVAAPEDVCRKFEGEKDEQDRYKPETLDNLFMRFEEPSSMVRWDSPLYTLSWQDDISKEKSTSINTNTGEMTPQKTSTTLDDLWIAVTAGVKKGPTAAVAQSNKPPPDALQVLTKTTSAILSSIQSHLALNPAPAPPLPVTTTSTGKPSNATRVSISFPPRAVPPSELQRLKRQFEGIQKRALTSGGTGAREGSWDEQAVSHRFARYLNECWL